MTENELSCPFQRIFGPGMRGMHRRLHEQIAVPGQRIMPVIRGAGIPVDLRDLEDEIVLFADLPGVESGDVATRLTGPGTLRITVRRLLAPEEEQGGYALRERQSGEMTRVVSLPADVTEEGATATLGNGVLAVRLRKVPGKQGIEIPVREEGK
ncbi:Hsp20/alpha crystallin family protein [Methanoculleus caldifontis]|nr:Hsp20/alpha crystallin family protein [Methanoculleus sp. Wushi-C6]